MSLAILDQLQTPELNPQAAFADATSSLKTSQTQANAGLSSSINLSAIIQKSGSIAKTLTDAAALNPNGSDATAALQPPLAVSELQSQISNRLGSLSELRYDNLTQLVPANPGVASLKGVVADSKVNDSLGGLTTTITGNANFAKLNVETIEPSPFDEFQRFLSNAGTLPSRVLDAIVTVFKKFLDKLSNPEAWLQDLSSESLSAILVEQIQGVSTTLPDQAIQTIQTEVARQTKILADYTAFLLALSPAELKQLDRSKISRHRQQVKAWTNAIATSNRTITVMMARLDTFKVTDFQAVLANLPNGVGTTRTSTLSQAFGGIQNFLTQLNANIEKITQQLKEFIQRLKDLLKNAITKAKEIAGNVVNTISQQIEKGDRALEQVTSYLNDAIATLEKFIQDACGQAGSIIAPMKQACNQIATQAIGGIETMSKTITEQTDRLNDSLGNVKQQIDTNLNQEVLEAKLKDLLDRVLSFLNSETIQGAIKKADAGIQQAVRALEKVSLTPAFDAAVGKTGELETKFRAIDVAKLGTAQKAALKVGVTIIKEVDVPGTVNPELSSAFQSVVDPLTGLVTSIQKECDQIDQKITSFKPGTLVEQWLSPYINALVEELKRYQPSLLLADLRQLYDRLLNQLEVLNPNQLVELLEQLYAKLEAIVAALNPKALVAFLNEKRKAIVNILDEFATEGIDKIVGFVNNSIGDAEKLLGGFGLDEILQSDFWQTLESILTINLDESIQQVDAIKQQIVDRMNRIDEPAIKAELLKLQVAVTTYTQDPTKAVADALAGLTDAVGEYQRTETLWTAQWAKSQIDLQAISDTLAIQSPPARHEFDLLDLRENRLSQLNMVLQEGAITSQLKVIQTRASKLPTPTAAQLKKLSETSQSRDSKAILIAFKQVVPQEIEEELAAPIRNILTTINNIIKKPREILDDVRSVMQQLAKAPGELAEILQAEVQRLGNVLRGAINLLKQKIVAFNFDFISRSYETIQETIKSLSPRQILNGFFDDSDFKGNPTLLLERLKNQTDEVSRYIWSKLDERKRNILNTQSDAGAKKILMDLLNQLLQDSQLYAQNRFSQYELSKEATELIKKGNLALKDQVRLNRLLLEKAYSAEITLSLESVFPTFITALEKLYPQKIIDSLDAIHANLIASLSAIPDILEVALNEKYAEVYELYKKAIRDKIYILFRALLKKIYDLEGEVDLGLEELGDAFDRLLVAIPV